MALGNKVKVSHGYCSRCGFEIICEDPTGCSRHHWLNQHFNAIDCIEILKNELLKLSNQNKTKDIEYHYDLIRRHELDDIGDV